MECCWSPTCSGLPPALASSADKYGLKQVYDADILCFKEMGMLSWTVVGWIAKEGMTLRVHDNMSHLTWTNQYSFENMFPDIIGNFKQKMVDYMSTLLGTHRAKYNNLQQDTTPSVLTCPDLALEQDSDGFPILPHPPGNMVQTQPELEMLV
ncbi:hypothetical protein J132_02681 [Termitomyces sp. J132]|nr:hypothetical protein J132_02681 [Termitomyces sp. J132]